jgi:hypothetical protein
MAMKKDDDKSKRTLSGKKPATFGGAKSKLMPSKPKAQSPVMVKPSPAISKNITGERNWDKSSSSRVMVSAGPYEISKGGKTPKSTGGTNASNAKSTNSKKSSPTAKMSGTTPMQGSNDPNTSGPQTVQGSQAQAAQQKAAGKRSGRLGLTLLGVVGGAGVAMSLRKNKEKRQAKRAARKESTAERKSGVMVVERSKKSK